MNTLELPLKVGTWYETRGAGLVKVISLDYNDDEGRAVVTQSFSGYLRGHYAEGNHYSDHRASVADIIAEFKPPAHEVGNVVRDCVGQVAWFKSEEKVVWLEGVSKGLRIPALSVYEMGNHIRNHVTVIYPTLDAYLDENPKSVEYLRELFRLEKEGK